MGRGMLRKWCELWKRVARGPGVCHVPLKGMATIPTAMDLEQKHPVPHFGVPEEQMSRIWTQIPGRE